MRRAWFALVCFAALPARAAELPSRLSETGLFLDVRTEALAPGVMGFEPRYPLWTDGATKQRWIALPPNTVIDASDPDHWRFPVGTRLWKEFSYGRRVETRFMELQPDGKWQFATYVWNDAQDDAVLAPAQGVVAMPVGTGKVHDVPGRWDCNSCHDGRQEGVLGFSALQLSADRDPLAPHAHAPRAGDVDLDQLIDRRLVVGLPADVRPILIGTTTARERAVAGYLNGNCGGCHNGEGALSTRDFRLDASVGHVFDVASLVEAGLLVPGDPDSSELVRRMRSRDAAIQMPPLGTREVDRAALDLIEAWIREDLVAATDAKNHESGPALEESAR